MNITMIAERGCTELHGPFDAFNIYRGKRALTGSESSFFNVARGLSLYGHKVQVLCDTEPGVVSPLISDELAGASVGPLSQKHQDSMSVVVSLNDPTPLERLSYPIQSGNPLRVVHLQYNDFNYVKKGFDQFVDVYVCLSPVHRKHIIDTNPSINERKVVWIPNSLVPLGENGTPDTEERNLKTAVWCSSPDRGLHRLLEIWPQVRRNVPGALLDIYYRLDPWLDRFWEENSKLGVRAKYIKICLDRLGRMGENGITVKGAVPNLELAKALRRAGVLPYTCDCTTFTEGFSVSIMDACRAGCLPIISDADAIGDIYENAAEIIPGKPGDHKDRWVAAIANAMTFSANINERKKVQEFAANFELEKVTKLWQQLITRESFLNPHESIADYLAICKNPNWLKLPNTGTEVITDPVGDMIAADEIQPPPPPPPVEEKTKPESPPLIHQGSIESICPPLRIAIILGSMSRSVHGIFNVNDVFERGNSLTGTGSNFFNLCWGLAERGHSIDAFTDMDENSIGCERFAGVNFYVREKVVIGDDYDCYISINEPDLLRQFPKNRLRIMQMQLNDLGYAQRGFDDAVDLYVCPSDAHARYLAQTQWLRLEKVFALPLSINPEFFEGREKRDQYKIVYCSSPDRGLHHLLKIFPEVRKQEPRASLHIYYRVKPWLEQTINNRAIDHPMRHRAELIEHGFQEMGENGANGLFLHGPVPTRIMARELMSSGILAYPCDPVYFTEGFSVSIMDACSAGCIPIISDADALPDVYSGVVRFIRGKPETRYDQWVTAILEEMREPSVQITGRTFAMQHTRQKIAKMWEALIRQRKK